MTVAFTLTHCEPCGRFLTLGEALMGACSHCNEALFLGICTRCGEEITGRTCHRHGKKEATQEKGQIDLWGNESEGMFWL